MKLKVNIDTKKGAEAVSNAFHKTSELSKKVASRVQKTAKDLSEKTKNDSYIRRMKKYNPLFPDKYFSEEFNLPNMIVIVDDAVRRGIDVCEGAIGWLSDENGIEVMYLYDEFIDNCELKFIPAVICDAVYYVDRFERKKFIQTDCLFSKAHEERLAELKHIAFSLGAKKFSVELSESSIETTLVHAKAEAKISGKLHGVDSSVGSSNDQKISFSGNTQRLGKIEAEFSGSQEITKPELKWFANDDNIKNLIKMRCGTTNTLKSEILILEGSASATMAKKTACAIDGAIGKIGGMKGKSDMETQAMKECQSKLIFNIEF